jgi:hypothetical protein
VSPADELRETLRQMLAVLAAERQALAGLDIDAIAGCTQSKQALCGRIDDLPAAVIDEECRAMIDAAKRLNEVNRQIRNLVAANVASRLDALSGSAALYRVPSAAVSIRTHN